MVDKRNRIAILSEYISHSGVDLNIGKNKARGNNGIFMHSKNAFRIDVSKDIEPEKYFSVLLHEFAHFIHYTYDHSLKSLTFVFDDFTDELRNELINVTVQEVPKEFAASLFEKKGKIINDIKILEKEIKSNYPDFKLSIPYKKIESKLPIPLNYLLKYDCIKYLGKIYTISNIKQYFDTDEYCLKYIQLRYSQRLLKRINSKIYKLNKYYNTPSELFARFIEQYYTNPEQTKIIAPLACKKIINSQIKQLKDLNTILT